MQKVGYTCKLNGRALWCLHWQVERVFADRNRVENDEEITEYLVKWKGLSYSESTWCIFLPSLSMMSCSVKTNLWDKCEWVSRHLLLLFSLTTSGIWTFGRVLGSTLSEVVLFLYSLVLNSPSLVQRSLVAMHNLGSWKCYVGIF